jgi:hypothetical protein
MGLYGLGQPAEGTMAFGFQVVGQFHDHGIYSETQNIATPFRAYILLALRY